MNENIIFLTPFASYLATFDVDGSVDDCGEVDNGVEVDDGGSFFPFCLVVRLYNFPHSQVTSH